VPPDSPVCIGQTIETDVQLAVDAFHEQVAMPGMDALLFFCSSNYDLDELAAAMQQKFAGTRLLGCTTSGEIGPAGYLQHGLSGVSFSSADFITESLLLEHLQELDVITCHTAVQQKLQKLESRQETAISESNCFAFMLVDGLSMREEKLAHMLQNELGRIPLVGGSAGDEQHFEQTFVYFDGRFHSDAAVVLLLFSRLPFAPFKTQHFELMQERMVVTSADPDQRVVSEINGLPAAEEYARLLGLTDEQLDEGHFAAYPVVVRVGDMDFVRSIQSAEADGSLRFYCAIEEGLVLHLTRGHKLVETLEHTFSQLHREIGEPLLTLGCDCILRRVEMERDGLLPAVDSLYRLNHLVGFNSYGEQFRGIHVNQTLTGIAIGNGNGKR